MKKNIKNKETEFPKASIVVPTYNHAPILRETIKGMLKLDYPNKYEIIVVNDGSKDNTKEMLKNEFSGHGNLYVINFKKNSGVCKARNAGIAKARFPIVINMDHDCIPEKDWLKDMVKGFDSREVGFVSEYADYGGTSTAFRKEALDKAGGYDEDYFYFREDSDLAFKIMEAGYKLKRTKAKYFHNHELENPKGIINLIKYGWKRIKYHQNDVLLYKKHPENPKVKEFLNIKFGFLVDPKKDFDAISGGWKGSELNVSSPRGITFMENKSILHAIAIIFIGIAYVIALKLVRLWGSIKYRKLLI